MKLFGIRWRFFGAAQTEHGWKSALVLFAVFVFAVWSGAMWSRSVGNSTVFWAANGVWAAALLLLPRRLSLAFSAAAVAVNGLVNVMGELPLLFNFAFTGLNLAFSSTVAALVRTFCGAGMDLGRLRRFLPFIGLVTLTAVVEGLIGATTVTLANSQATSFPTLWARWTACDASGMILALPATLMMMRRANPLYAGRAGQVERWAILLGLGTAAYAAFAGTGAPLFLLLYPAVLFAAFRLGSAWAFVAVWIVAQAATVQTLADRGPISLFDSGIQFQEVGLLQLFLISLLLTASLATSAMAERVRAEQRLRRREAAAAAARARADQMSATRQRFLAVVSHEIRTPLNGILGFTHALAAQPGLDAEARRQVAMIGRQTDALAAIVEDILDFSRLESNRFELDPAPARVPDVLTQVADIAGEQAAAKGLAFRLVGEALGEDLHRVDARRLRQVLAILAGNAVKFTAAGSVEIRAAREAVAEGDRFTFRVLDTGEGVAAEKQGELFRPFSQLDPSLTRRHAGTGLGLAICRALVELMHGETAYEPRAGGGSEFRIVVTLPNLGPAEAVNPAEDQALDRAPRVLVVDDHPVNREVARLILTACGCEVAECEDGAEAVEAAATQPFDAILMDVRMPGMDGLAATRAIRALGGAAGRTPIVAVTADVMRGDVQRCREAGMNGHVPKPINQDKLLNALNLALAGGDGFQAQAA